METLSLIMLLFALFCIMVAFSARIPKTGRSSDANGEIIEATIVNSNKYAEKAVTLRAKAADGRLFKVKIKPTEAKLWIKGDTISILLSKDKKKYRVLFHEYFKENEERIREEALSLMKKRVRPEFFAARIVGYTENSLDAFARSKADSHVIFTFSTLMRLIDIYSVFCAVIAVVFVLWYLATSQPASTSRACCS